MRKRVVPSWNQFSAPEIEESCNMPTRTMEQLKREGLVPDAIIGGGRGKTALYDFNGLAYFICVSALLKVVPSLLVAGKLATGIIEELKVAYGQVPFGLNEFDRLLKSQGLNLNDVFDENGKVMPLAIMNKLMTMPNIYQQGRVEDHDYRLMIINGRYVLSRTNGTIPHLNGVVLDGVHWAPELILEPIERGKDVQVFHLHEYLNGDIKAVCEEFQTAVEKAETRVELNISLPIRNVLHEILEGRFRTN